MFSVKCLCHWGIFSQWRFEKQKVTFTLLKTNYNGPVLFKGMHYQYSEDIVKYLWPWRRRMEMNYNLKNAGPTLSRSVVGQKILKTWFNLLALQKFTSDVFHLVIRRKDMIIILAQFWRNASKIPLIQSYCVSQKANYFHGCLASNMHKLRRFSSPLKSSAGPHNQSLATNYGLRSWSYEIKFWDVLNSLLTLVYGLA